MLGAPSSVRNNGAARALLRDANRGDKAGGCGRRVLKMTGAANDGGVAGGYESRLLPIAASSSAYSGGAAGG